MTTVVSGRASELGKLCVNYQFQRLDRFGPAPSGSDLNLVLRPNDSDDTLIGKLGKFEEALSLSTIPFLVAASDWARLPKDFSCEVERGKLMLALADHGQAYQLRILRRHSRLCLCLTGAFLSGSRAERNGRN